jgi:catechol 2,3-dioxygenase-like lactoylglutathione lyase family enzyme
MADAKKARAVGFNHVALEVGDIEEALAFYGRLFISGHSSVQVGCPKSAISRHAYGGSELCFGRFCPDSA